LKRAVIGLCWRAPMDSGDKTTMAPRDGRDPPQDADWSQLMAQSQAGDRRCYAALLGAITPYLRVLARRTGLFPDEVEDCVQDVLLTLHQIRHTYDPARPFGPWLVAIARRRYIDRLRQAGRRAKRETPLTEAHETFPADQSNHYEETSDLRQLRAAIAALPSGQRQAVELLRLKELSVKEASAISGQSGTALKVAVHRAVKRLRQMMEGS
jgi:RNA polymerase sigma-70 factor, ECF subfamily